MAFYYVKSGGTATGDGGRYASEKANNSWATEFTATSEYYDSIEDAMNATTVYVDGDFIFISSASSLANGSAINLTLGTVTDSPVMIYSVDDSAVNDYLAGAFEDTTGTTQDYSIGTAGLIIKMHGVTLRATDDFNASLSNSGFMLEDSTLRLGASGSRSLRCANDGAYFTLNNSHIVSDVGTTGGLLEIFQGGVFEMCGGSTSATSGSLNDLISGGGTNGGMTVTFNAVDLSGHGSGTFLLGNVGNSRAADDAINVRINACKLAANVGFVEESFANRTHKFLMTNSSSDSDAAEYQFFQRTWAGDVEDQDDSGIHRDESTAFDGGTKVSIKVVTNADCNAGRPLIVDLPARFAALSSASTDTIRIYFAQANTQADLTDVNCWAEVHYPDGTNKNEYNRVSNQATLLTTGTQHTDDSGSSTWLDGVSALTGHDEYRMDISTSGDVGADSVPIIRIYIAEPSITVYFDTTVDVVA